MMVSYRNIPTWQIDYLLRSLSPVADIDIENRIGHNPDVGATAEWLWHLGGTETLLTAGATMYASSTNAADTGMVLYITGLDENWDRQYGLVTLNGQSQVEITKVNGSAAQWTRICNTHQVSALPGFVGDVYIAESDTLTLGVPNTATKIHDLVEGTDGENNSEKAICTIPRNHTGFILGGRASLLTASGTTRAVDVGIAFRPLARGATVSNPSWSPFNTLAEIGLVTSGTSTVSEGFDTPMGPIAGLTDIVMYAKATAASIVTGNFYVLILNNKWIGLSDQA